MLGEFFGITGATSLLLDMSRTNIVRLSSMLNNPLDVFRLRKFKTELLYLKEVLDGIRLEYNSPEIRKIERKIFLIEEGRSQSLKRHGIDLDSMSEEEKGSLLRKLNQEIEELVSTQNVEEGVVNSFKDLEGNRISLGQEELDVILRLKKYYYPVLGDYLKSVNAGSFKEITAFGEKIFRIASSGPGYLLVLVENMFSDPTVNIESLRKICLEGVEVIRSHYPLDGEKTKSDVDVDSVIESISFEEFWRRSSGQLTTEETPEEVIKLSDIFWEESVEFLEILRKLLETGSVSIALSKDLIDLYCSLFRMDYDLSYLSSLLHPSKEMTKDEISSVFNNLNRIGLFYFHFNNSKMFVESLKKISFSTESKTIIDPEREINGLTFRRVVDDIELLCKSMIPAGSDIEGV